MDATVMKRAMTFGKSVAAIQLATRSIQEKIAWENFEDIGEIYLLVENNQLKVLTGLYPNIDAAKADLLRVRNKGFKDAFPKTLNSARLHKPSVFELGDYKQNLIPLEFDAQNGNPTSIDLRVKDDFRTKGEMDKAAKISPATTAISKPPTCQRPKPPLQQ
ncbi:MAG: hypothetical protein HC912_02170 [Saprospiraceae bacterium]|nr:hypothetical protein [Saprospiraceae bacterium]